MWLDLSLATMYQYFTYRRSKGVLPSIYFYCLAQSGFFTNENVDTCVSSIEPPVGPHSLYQSGMEYQRAPTVYSAPIMHGMLMTQSYPAGVPPPPGIDYPPLPTSTSQVRLVGLGWE